ncbi:hypothetical protein BD779DRAFT_1479391 [Infundibulicybe gibba]|nr:hypothetical protein BD779DRAFT_1479391 [Infundibulicybe gibba]
MRHLRHTPHRTLLFTPLFSPSLSQQVAPGAHTLLRMSSPHTASWGNTMTMVYWTGSVSDLVTCPRSLTGPKLSSASLAIEEAVWNRFIRQPCYGAVHQIAATFVQAPNRSSITPTPCRCRPDMGFGSTDGFQKSQKDYGNDDDSDSDFHFEESDGDGWSSDEESLAEFEDDELEENLRELLGLEDLPPTRTIIGDCSSQYKQINEKKSKEEWQTAEKNRGLGYNGHSKRTQQRKAKGARERADFREKAKTSTDPQIVMMHNMFTAKPKPTSTVFVGPLASTINHNAEMMMGEPDPFTGYWSDMSADDEEIDGSEDEDGLGTGLEGPSVVASGSKRLPTVPPLKRQKLDVPYREARRLKREAQTSELMQAFEDITKMLTSKKTKFIGGINGLQARRARAMHAHMQLVVKKNCNFTTASMVAAEGHGFAPHWGGRQVRSWTRAWVKTRKLPVSWRGRHAKTDSLLADPAIAAQCRTYLHSHKWSMDPSTLAQFSKNELIPAKAKKYLEQIVNEEMPRGLKKFMEIELFPRIHLKYRQKVFLPAMKGYGQRLARYVVGDVDKELEIQPQNYVERRLVLLAHNEMTSQANDAREKTWVFQDQHALRKKGAGRGIHLSEVICSTYGHMKDAGQSLEYGKNYDGYWTGELFVKQVDCSRRDERHVAVCQGARQVRQGRERGERAHSRGGGNWAVALRQWACEQYRPRARNKGACVAGVWRLGAGVVLASVWMAGAGRRSGDRALCLEGEMQLRGGEALAEKGGGNILGSQQPVSRELLGKSLKALERVPAPLICSTLGTLCSEAEALLWGGEVLAEERWGDIPGIAAARFLAICCVKGLGYTYQGWSPCQRRLELESVAGALELAVGGDGKGLGWLVALAVSTVVTVVALGTPPVKPPAEGGVASRGHDGGGWALVPHR